MGMQLRVATPLEGDMALTTGERREQARGKPARTEPEGAARSAEVIRLSNRVAMLTFLTAFALVMALVTVRTMLADGSGALLRIAAAVPSLTAIAAAVWLRRVRAQLRLAREHDAPSASAGSALQKAARSAQE